jgi:hypothetical protein
MPSFQVTQSVFTESQERQELQKAAFLQSISTSITPSITIIAIIVTIMALT